MQRLIDDANKVREANGEMANLSIESFADIVVAIETMQDKMGISGTTAREAGTTIEGSVKSMKSAWTNLVTGLADGNADIEDLVEDLVTTIVGDGTEKNLGVIGNILPAIETALGGAARLIEGAAPKIIEILPKLIRRIAPSLISAATGLVNSVIAVLPDLLSMVVDAIIQNAPVLITAAIGLVKSLIQGVKENYQILVDGAVEIVNQLAGGILSMLPEIIRLGLDLIVSLANGIAESLPTLIPTIIDVVLQIVETLTNPETLSKLLDAALTLILALAEGLLSEDSINGIIDAVFMLIDNLIAFLTDPENIMKIINTAMVLVEAIADGLILAVDKIIESAGELIEKLSKRFSETDWAQLGKDIVNGIWNGLKNVWNKLTGWFTEKWEGLVGGVKDLLGIHSPSRVFAGIGRNMALGVGEGWEDEFGDIQGNIDKSLSFDDAGLGIRNIGLSHKGAFGGTSIGSITINIDGAKYNDEQSLASAIALEIQNMTERRAAAYA